jgi:tetratricopeptide (TPR) repeat protein
VRLHQSGRRAEAEPIYRRVLARDPHNADALHLLGLIDLSQNRLADGVARLEAAARLRPAQRAPAFPPAQFALATIHHARGEFEAAYESARRAAELNPQSLQYHLFHADAAMRTLRVGEAIVAAERAVQIAPDDAAAHWNLALALLTAGQFERGWAEFEWRLKLPALAHLRRDFREPFWHRQHVSRATVLLHCEGGFGDALQFMRYLPMVEERAARVLLECPPPLHALFARLPGRHQLIARGENIPPFDFHCPLQSLPLNLGTRTIESIPAAVPYLQADRERGRALCARLPLADGLHVGLVWAGSADAHERRSRSLEVFAPLADVPNVCFVSLQKGPAAAQVSDPPRGMQIVDAAPLLNDFADTADVIANLDLVITVDTSVAHLAGALAKPVWTLIPHSPDFRWMLGRSDSPWYPTMRLFRQRDPRDWFGVARMIADALRELTRASQT